MKIIFDHQIFSLQKYGGISRYFMELAKQIIKKNIQLNILSPVYINNYITRNLNKENIRGFKLPHLKKASFIYGFINQALSSFLINNYNPNLVHETYYSHYSIAPSSSKIIITVHDMIHELYPNNFDFWYMTKSKKLSSIKRADHIICVSENTRKDLINIYNIDIKKTSVIYHGYKLNSLSTETRRHLTPYILFVGNRGGYKNFKLLLKAYASKEFFFKNFSIVIFGGGTLSTVEKNEIFKLSKGKWKVYHFEGDDTVLADLYRYAELFVYPSLYEGFGMCPLEAMSFGCPVISSNQSSLPEILGNAVEFFDPKSIDSIIYAMEKVLMNKIFKKNIVLKGFEHIKNFSWEKCANETLDVYRKII